MKIRWFVIVLLIVLFILALATGSTMLWRFFVFLGVLLFMSYLWMRMNVRHIVGKVVKLTPYGRIGERFEQGQAAHIVN
jgi:phosphatidylglycerophosphate synthase